MPGARAIWVTFLLLSVGIHGSAQQLPEGTDDTAAQLRQLAVELKATHAELEAYRAEVEKLRRQVDVLKRAVEAPSQATAPRESGAGESSSVESRVATLEDEQQMLAQKVDDQYQTKVESGSRYRLKLTGTLLFNVSGNSGVVDDTDVPNLAASRGQLDSSGNFGATLRQSELGLQLNGPDIWGAHSSADLYFDFFGGLPSTIDGATMGIARLRVARGRLDWANTSLVFGQDAPFISPLSPTSIASLATPSMGYSGNLWNWVPQVRIAHRWTLGEKWTYALEGGFMDPLSGEYPEYRFRRQPEAGEKSRVPAFATRSSVSREVMGRKLTVGAGGYYTRQDYGLGREVDGWAATADWNLPLAHWLEWSGEAYRGRAIGGLWGAIGTSIVSSGPLDSAATRVAGLNDAGGWTQLKFHASPRVEFNVAYGEDSPYASDFRLFGPPAPYSAITRNQTMMVNFIHRMRSNFLFSLEYRHLNTAWAAAPSETANHVDAAVGVTF